MQRAAWFINVISNKSCCFFMKREIMEIKIAGKPLLRYVGFYVI